MTGAQASSLTYVACKAASTTFHFQQLGGQTLFRVGSRRSVQAGTPRTPVRFEFGVVVVGVNLSVDILGDDQNRKNQTRHKSAFHFSFSPFYFKFFLYRTETF